MTTTTAETRVVRGIFDAIDQGFTEQGIPLTAEQRAFLFDGVDGMEASVR